MLWSQTSFQNAASPPMLDLYNFHNMAMITITMIMLYVILGMTSNLASSQSITPPLENHELETIWTLLPGAFLVGLALPSLHLLYIMEESVDPSLTLKIIAHQWYWSYEYADFNTVSFDSFMSPPESLSSGDFRLLEVDNRMVLPWITETRLLLTSADVLHSWTIPSMGVKADAVPGRLNQIMLTPSKPGVFYGQCSEICGANHSFMPISMEVISSQDWVKWASTIQP